MEMQTEPIFHRLLDFSPDSGITNSAAIHFMEVGTAKDFSGDIAETKLRHWPPGMDRRPFMPSFF